MPAGPALVARRTGAALIPIVCQFTPRGMRIVFGDPVPHRPGRDGLVAMVQEVADFFVADHRHPAGGLAHDAAVLPGRRHGPEQARAQLRPCLAAARSGSAWSAPTPWSLRAACRATSSASPATCSTRATSLRPGPGGLPPTWHPTLDAGRFSSAGAAVPLRYNGSVARVSFGPLSAARVRRWLSASPLRPGARPRARHAEHRPAGAVGRRAAGGRDLPHRHPPVPVDAAGRRRAPTGDREAGRLDRGVGDGAARGGPAPGPGRRGHSQRLPVRRLRPEPTTGRRRQPAAAGLPRAGRRAAQGSRRAAGRAAGHPAGGAGPGGGHRRTRRPAAARRGAPASAWSARREKVDLLGSADVFVAPHRARESFGIVVLEAMASGVPVVAADLAPFVDLLGPSAPGEPAAGALFPSGDPQALARSVIGVLRRPDPARTALARQRARSYDWSAVGAAVLSVYRARWWPRTPGRRRVRCRADHAQSLASAAGRSVRSARVDAQYRRMSRAQCPVLAAGWNNLRRPLCRTIPKT